MWENVLHNAFLKVPNLMLELNSLSGLNNENLRDMHHTIVSFNKQLELENFLSFFDLGFQLEWNCILEMSFEILYTESLIYCYVTS